MVFVVGEYSCRASRVRVQQENEIVGEQEASTVQRDKQKEMNIREKLLFWGKRKEKSYTHSTCGRTATSASPFRVMWWREVGVSNLGAGGLEGLN